MPTLRQLAAAVAAVLLASTTTRADVITEYSAGHADIGVAIEDGNLHLHYHFGGDAILNPASSEDEFDPADIYIRISDAGIATLPTAGPYAGQYAAMLGVAAGSDVWIAPQVNNPLLPFLGFATEELPPGFGDVAFKLLSVTGPGQFALWTVGTFGNPTELWSTALGMVGDSYAVTLATPQHAHYNWGFTEAGLYQLTIAAQSVNDPSLYDEGVFTFAVGSDTLGPQAVPEPSSMLLCGLTAVGFGFQRQRRKRALSRATASTIAESAS